MRAKMKNSGNKTKYLILGLLSEEILSGYEIKKIVDTRFSFFWNESFGQIYPQLKKLSEDHLIEDTSSNESDNNKSSKKYSITKKGRLELKEWLEEPVEKETVRYEILLKMYFSNIISPEIMLGHIKEFQISHRNQLKLFEKFQLQLEEYIDVHGNHEDILMVLSFGQKVWKAYDDWCEEVSKVLEKRTEGGEKE
jgi:DNA-binding PadR family transcriptional regulator